VRDANRGRSGAAFRERHLEGLVGGARIDGVVSHDLQIAAEIGVEAQACLLDRQDVGRPFK
jgi:hypothetical protein